MSLLADFTQSMYDDRLRLSAELTQYGRDHGMTDQIAKRLGGNIERVGEYEAAAYRRLSKATHTCCGPWPSVEAFLLHEEAAEIVGRWEGGEATNVDGLSPELRAACRAEVKKRRDAHDPNEAA